MWRGTGECGLEQSRDCEEHHERAKRGPAPRSEQVRENGSDSGPRSNRGTVREPAQAPLEREREQEHQHKQDRADGLDALRACEANQARDHTELVHERYGGRPWKPDRQIDRDPRARHRGKQARNERDHRLVETHVVGIVDVYSKISQPLKRDGQPIGPGHSFRLAAHAVRVKDGVRGPFTSANNRVNATTITDAGTPASPGSRSHPCPNPGRRRTTPALPAEVSQNTRPTR